MAPILVKVGGYRHRSKVAAFDFDWTLVKPKDHRRFPKDVEDWQWLRPNVPDVVRAWHEKGWSIVVFTNQTKEWKVEQITKAVESLGVPALIAIAMDKTEHKPSRAMWEAAMGDRKVAMDPSFFVGDALGRKGDWSDTDKLFADAVGIRAMGPEDAFALDRS